MSAAEEQKPQQPQQQQPSPPQQQQKQQKDNNSYMRLRNPSLVNYRRVIKTSSETREDELRVTSQGGVFKYVFYATKVFEEQQKETLTICATGKAISIAVSACELIKRRVSGLHQLTTIGWTEIVDEYEPLQEELPPRSIKRNVPSITILITKQESSIDKNAVGYQPPLDASLMGEADYDFKPQRSPRGNNRREQPGQGEVGKLVAADGNRNSGRGRRGRRGRGRGVRGGRNRRGAQQQQQQQPQQEPILVNNPQ